MISPRQFRSVRTLALATACTAFGVLGCKSNAPADDNALNSAITAKLHSDGALASESIQTSVQSGVATLTGAVSSQAARSLAANDVAQVAGVHTVINNLSVGGALQQASVLPPPPAETVTTPPPAPVQTISKKPTAVVDRRPVQAPIKRQQQPAPLRSAPPQVTQVVPQSPPPPPAPTFHDVTIPAGTTIPIRLTQTLDSATTQQGDSFSGSVASDILIDGLVAIPQGSNATGRVDTVQEAAHFKGNSLLAIELTGINRRGDRLAVTTDPFSKAGAGRGKNTAEKVGGGAAVGAILGGIFGGGKGAAIGAAAGGGAGAGANTITRGQQVQIPSETLVNFKLTSSLSVRVRTSPGTQSQTPNPSPNQDLNQNPGQRRPLN